MTNKTFSHWRSTAVVAVAALSLTAAMAPAFAEEKAAILLPGSAND